MFELPSFRFILIIAISVLCGCSSKQPDNPAADIHPAYVTTVRHGDLPGADFVGEIRSAQRAELGFAVAGKVIAVSADVGDHVHAGQVLARLDEQPLRAQVTAAAAEVAKADAALREVRLRADRLHLAQQAAATSPSELSAIEAERSAAESGFQAARAQLNQAKWALDNAVLRAPFNGVIAERAVEMGQAIAPGLPVFKMDGEGRELSVLLPERMAFKAGHAVLLKNAGQLIPSRVLRANGRMEAGGLRRVFLAAPDDATVGSTWSVIVRERDESASSAAFVPLRSIRTTGVPGEGQVLRLTQDGQTIEVVTVRLGNAQRDWIEVKSGLNAADRILVAATTDIGHGSRIKALPYVD